MSKYRELLPGTNLKEFLMVFLPIIATNLGKIAAAAATTLGIVGYVNRGRISRWLADEEPAPKERKLGHLQDAAGVLETAESLKNLHAQLAPDGIRPADDVLRAIAEVSRSGHPWSGAEES